MNFLKALGMAIGGLFIGLVVVLIGIVGIFLFAILGALIGAITGWILSYTPILGDAVRAGFTSVLEVENPDRVAIGAMLGFIAGFFKNWGDGHHPPEKKDKGWFEECKEEWSAEDIPEVHIDVKPKRKSRSRKK